MFDAFLEGIGRGGCYNPDQQSSAVSDSTPASSHIHVDSIILWGAYCAPVNIGVTKICRIAGSFLLIAMISVIVQGTQPGETGYGSQIDGRSLALRVDPGTGESISNLQVVQVTNSTLDQFQPRISGNRILWVEDELDGTMSLYLYDITNRSGEIILDRFSCLTVPEMSGNWIGWVENRSDSSGNYFPCICVYDILNGTTTQVTRYPAMPMQTSRSKYLTLEQTSTLDISGDMIVWHDNRRGNMDIYCYNLSSMGKPSADRLLSSSPADETCPSISGDRVIWAEQYEMEGYIIYLYNLTSGDLKRVTERPAMRRNQVISGDHIVWSQWRDTDYDICCYDIVSGNTTWITDEPRHQLWPEISGDVIAWSDYRRGLDGEIYAYDLSTQTETLVTNASTGSIWADVDSNNIVWSDNRTGNFDIYLCSLENRSDAVSQMYTVHLDSVPEGADVYANNESWGRTPTTLYFDRPGSCPIELVKKGFRPYLTTLNVSTSMTYVVILEQEVPGRPAGIDILIDVTIDSVPRGANVSIGDVPYGTTLITVADLPASEYQVEVSLEGYQSNNTTVRPSGSINEVNLTLIPEETNGTNGGLLTGNRV